VLERKKPAHGVWVDQARPTIVFVTVCTKDRRPWLATKGNHETLRIVWTEATAWVVGRYVLMPDSRESEAPAEPRNRLPPQQTSGPESGRRLIAANRPFAASGGASLRSAFPNIARVLFRGHAAPGERSPRGDPATGCEDDAR
jgi:hypothetical protein